MSVYPAMAAKQWSVTDQQLMSLIQLALLEPDDAGATWPSGMWSAADVVGYINNRQRQFLAETGITRAISFVNGVASQAAYAIPQTTIDVTRAAWGTGSLSPSGFVDLAREDSWELDEGTDNWPQAAAQQPSAYRTNLLGVQQIQLTPTPNDIGLLELTTTDTGATVTGAGVALSIPDDWTPYLAFGVMADMLSKQGEACDPDRAAYCASRWAEGIALGRLMIEGVS